MPRRPTHPLPEIAAALRAHRGAVAPAARQLGVTRQSLSALIGRTPELQRALRAALPRERRCPTCRGAGTVRA